MRTTLDVEPCTKRAATKRLRSQNRGATLRGFMSERAKHLLRRGLVPAVLGAVALIIVGQLYSLLGGS